MNYTHTHVFGRHLQRYRLMGLRLCSPDLFVANNLNVEIDPETHTHTALDVACHFACLCVTGRGMAENILTRYYTSCSTIDCMQNMWLEF